MLSWFSRKLYWLKQRRKSKQTAHQTPAEQTKWHKACLWLAHSVGGIDMLLRDDGTVIVISKSSCTLESFADSVISKSKYGSVRSYLRVNMLVDEESKKFEFKTIDAWSEDLAKFIATIVSLTPPNPKLDPPERWGVMIFSPTSVDELPSKTEVLFPTFKSEEELFMTMALDGVAIDEKDSADAQS